MAHQTGSVTIPAKGDAPSQLGPTPAPVKPYQNPTMKPRDFKGGYGENNYSGPSSLPPGQTMAGTGSLSDDLRGKAAESDAGDLLGEIIRGGTGRSNKTADLMSPQTRDIGTAGRVPIHPSMARRSVDEGSPGSSVPSALDKSDATPIRKPGA